MHANLCSLFINKCPNYVHISLNFISFDLNIFGPFPVISAETVPAIVPMFRITEVLLYYHYSDN